MSGAFEDVMTSSAPGGSSGVCMSNEGTVVSKGCSSVAEGSYTA